MFTSTKQFAFEASHQLPDMPPGHQCGRLHGHSYRVEVELASKRLDEHGFVLDYGELKVFEEYLKARYDHRHLNDLMLYPTAEHLAVTRYDWLLFNFPQWPVTAVRVSETAKTWAEFRPDA